MGVEAIVGACFGKCSILLTNVCCPDAPMIPFHASHTPGCERDGAARDQDPARAVAAPQHHQPHRCLPPEEEHPVGEEGVSGTALPLVAVVLSCTVLVLATGTSRPAPNQGGQSGGHVRNDTVDAQELALTQLLSISHCVPSVALTTWMPRYSPLPFPCLCAPPSGV